MLMIRRSSSNAWIEVASPVESWSRQTKPAASSASALIGSSSATNSASAGVSSGSRGSAMFTWAICQLPLIDGQGNRCEPALGFGALDPAPGQPADAPLPGADRGADRDQRPGVHLAVAVSAQPRPRERGADERHRPE